MAKCCICEDLLCGAAFAPCGHADFCFRCASRLSACPMCRLPGVPIRLFGRIIISEEKAETEKQTESKEMEQKEEEAEPRAQEEEERQVAAPTSVMGETVYNWLDFRDLELQLLVNVKKVSQNIYLHWDLATFNARAVAMMRGPPMRYKIFDRSDGKRVVCFADVPDEFRAWIDRLCRFVRQEAKDLQCPVTNMATHPVHVTMRVSQGGHLYTFDASENMTEEIEEGVATPIFVPGTVVPCKPQKYEKPSGQYFHTLIVRALVYAE